MNRLKFKFRLNGGPNPCMWKNTGMICG